VNASSGKATSVVSVARIGADKHFQIAGFTATDPTLTAGAEIPVAETVNAVAVPSPSLTTAPAAKFPVPMCKSWSFVFAGLTPAPDKVFDAICVFSCSGGL
jgi:hypothetical protein